MRNHLKEQTSPYLLQHVENPVDWYPWGQEAFERAKKEDKPVFLSIGYSTCHWCHVMAHESFEDEEIAQILNQYFIAVKVDKEERPDIDSIYMAVCQAFTGSGGWPTTVFLTPEQKPFFAGTYFPKEARYGQIGLKELLMTVHKKWESDRSGLLESAEEIVSYLNKQTNEKGRADEKIVASALEIYEQIFDRKYGGFGNAPKFPTPHNLFFLMGEAKKRNNEQYLKMVEKTLLQMYKGGLFDHIGGGFCRYSTDKYFLAPHFEKMLYDNALLIQAYCLAHELTKNPLYLEVAEKTGKYILREMTDENGGFCSAMDADSEGEEGKFYLFKPEEIRKILGEDKAKEYCSYYDITEQGNFEGKSIPNLLKQQEIKWNFDIESEKIYVYRKNRYRLHLDDKILTAWNGLMIASMCQLYRLTGKAEYLRAAVNAWNFIEEKLCQNTTLYVSYRNGKLGEKGFLDEYSSGIFALIALYGATLDEKYMDRAEEFCAKACADFADEENGGFFLYGKENERLIFCPKETYDGAIPSGNSMMAYNFVQLYFLTDKERYRELAEKQLDFMAGKAEHYPPGYAMFLMALSDYLMPPDKITVIVKEKEKLEKLPCKLPISAVVRGYEAPQKEYPLKNDKTTYYVCSGHSCKPPVNELADR